MELSRAGSFYVGVEGIETLLTSPANTMLSAGRALVYARLPSSFPGNPDDCNSFTRHSTGVTEHGEPRSQTCSAQPLQINMLE